MACDYDSDENDSLWTRLWLAPACACETKDEDEDEGEVGADLFVLPLRKCIPMQGLGLGTLCIGWFSSGSDCQISTPFPLLSHLSGKLRVQGPGCPSCSTMKPVAAGSPMASVRPFGSRLKSPDGATACRCIDKFLLLSPSILDLAVTRSAASTCLQAVIS